jgi:hypothetical protein
VQQADFLAFAQAIGDAHVAVPACLRAAGGAPLQERFSIHRNNVHLSLVEALADNFPVTQALVGDEFFHAMARLYVQVHKPAHAQLHAYGRNLPQFIDAFGPARGLRYLADVARLEVAWGESWAAADASVLTLAALASQPEEMLLQARVAIHSATRLLRSPWPIGSIWQAHQAGNPDLSALAWQAECVLVTRPEARIELRQLPAGLACFAESLLQQQLRIEQAATATISICPDFDTGSALGALIKWGAITEIVTS